jgi:ABC-type transporter Mla subunit MlaD
MTDPSRYPDSESHATRRWVRVVGIVALVVVLLVAVMLLVGGRGGHGPRRHLGGGATPASGVTGYHHLAVQLRPGP